MNSNENLTISYKDRTIDNRYQILETVGSGAMSVVYKAKDLTMNRTVALKLLNDELANNEKAIRRFANESKAVAMISHDTIVKIYDVNLDHEPKYIAMEYVSGLTLKQYMEENAPLSADVSVQLMQQILNALRHVHENGIVHLDVKPENIIITEDSHIKLTDFGIARFQGSENTDDEEKAMGTVSYISPEQANAQTVDFKSDVYSAGVILYEMLAGRLPFEGDTPLSVAIMHAKNQPVAPRKYNETIPPALEQIILKAMEKDPSKRFHSAASMRRALKLYSKDNTIVLERDTLDSMDQTALEAQPAKETAKKKKKKKKSPRVKHGRRTMFPIIFGVTCAFLTVFLIAGLFALVTILDMSKDSSITIIVPDLKGQQYSKEYAKSLEDSNLKVSSVEYVYDKDSANGVIVEQQPKAGERKKLKDNTHFCEITLKVSRGNETVIVPDIAISEYRNAVILLEEQNLRYKIVSTFNSSILDGYVIQTEPAAGTPVPKNSEITVYVSLGQEIGFTAMPDLKGKTLNEAKTLLAQSSLTLGKVTREPSQSPTGTILSQSIDAGKSVPKKYTVVDLVLSMQIPVNPLPLPTAAPTTKTPATTVPPTTAAPIKPPVVTVAPPTKAPPTKAPHTQPPATTIPVTTVPVTTVGPDIPVSTSNPSANSSTLPPLTSASVTVSPATSSTLAVADTDRVATVSESSRSLLENTSNE